MHNFYVDFFTRSQQNNAHNHRIPWLKWSSIISRTSIFYRTYFLFALLTFSHISHALYETGSLDNLGSPLSGNITDTNATAKIEVCWWLGEQEG